MKYFHEAIGFLFVIVPFIALFRWLIALDDSAFISFAQGFLAAFLFAGSICFGVFIRGKGRKQ